MVGPAQTLFSSHCNCNYVVVTEAPSQWIVKVNNGPLNVILILSLLQMLQGLLILVPWLRNSSWAIYTYADMTL